MAIIGSAFYPSYNFLSLLGTLIKSLWRHLWLIQKQEV